MRPQPTDDRFPPFVIALEHSSPVSPSGPISVTTLKELIRPRSVNRGDLLPHDLFNLYDQNSKPRHDDAGDYDFKLPTVQLIWSTLVTAVEVAADLPFGKPLERLWRIRTAWRWRQ